MNCPHCNAPMIERDERFPECEECGHVEYDAFTLALMAETRREFEQAKRECYPDPVPSYREYVKTKS